MDVDMEHKSKGCKKWNEHWYWTHLEPTRIQFSKLLTTEFDQRLVLPRKIIFKFREQLVNTATLKSLSGKAWTIGLEQRDEDLFFQQGWAGFVKDNSLKKGDMLTFRYEADSTFSVSMFDGRSGYEKIGSFINYGLQTSCNKRENNVHMECSREGSSSDDSSSDQSNPYSSSMDSSSDNIICLGSGRSDRRKGSHVNETIDKIETESEDNTPPRKKARKVERRSGMNQRSNRSSTSDKGKSVCRESNSRGEQSSTELSNLSDTGERIINLDKGYPMSVSQRRQAEKEKAYKLACAFRSSIPGFVVTMVATSVCSPFLMTIPHKFVKEYIPTSVKEFVLHVPPGVKKWVVRYDGYLKHGVGLCRGSCNSVHLCRRFKNFVLDNNLKPGDACVFELTQQQGNRNPGSIAMDVKIFRVVEILTQSTKAS